MGAPSPKILYLLIILWMSTNRRQLQMSGAFGFFIARN